MGRPKLNLPWKGRTVLEHAVAAMTQGGVNAVVVVIGPGNKELQTLAQAAGAAVLELDRETADMRETVERGLKWIQDRYQPVADDGWLLLPADHPAVETQVVQQLLAAHLQQPACSIVVPVFEQRRGHPAWIAWHHVAGIRATAAGKGLNTYFRQYSNETLEVAVSTASILWDLDTPEDYQRLVK